MAYQCGFSQTGKGPLSAPFVLSVDTDVQSSGKKKEEKRKNQVLWAEICLNFEAM